MYLEKLPLILTEVILTVDTTVLSAQPKLFVHVGTEVKEFDLKDSKETVSL